MNANAVRVLVVDDDRNMATALGNALSEVGYCCDLASSGPAAVRAVAEAPFDAVVSDLAMEGMSGAELCKTLTLANPKLPVIIVSGAGSSRGPTDAMESGAFHYLTKPFGIDELRGVIEQAIGDAEHRQDADEERSGDRPGDVLLPTGPAIRAILGQIDRLASSDAPVLIRGETGTGKELVARAIHERGPRKNGQFVAVNAAAIPESLLESEIFGHVRGAFTGATQARPGLLALASHGTLLLDEIGDMPLPLQAKLLRVLQFGEVRPVGSDRAHHVDVRFIASTHHDLKASVLAGRFREDLYFRLNTLEVHMPPLRERRGEIPALVAHFLARARERRPQAIVRSIADDAMRVLVEAPWPGNVRQLASAVERLAVLAESSVVTEEDLAFLAVQTPRPWANASVLLDAERDLCTLDQLSERYVDWVLTHTKGNKVRAAEILGVNLSTLYRWKRARPG